MNGGHIAKTNSDCLFNVKRSESKLGYIIGQLLNVDSKTLKLTFYEGSKFAPRTLIKA